MVTPASSARDRPTTENGFCVIYAPKCPRRERGIDLVSLMASADEEKNEILPSIVGALGLAGDVVLVNLGARKS